MSISIPILKSNQFRCPVTKQFDPYTKTKSFPTPTQNQVNSDPFTEIKSISISHADIKSISSAQIKPSKFQYPHKTNSFSARTQKLSQFRPPTQKPSQSILTLKTSHFHPAHKNQVNFDPHTTTKSISIHALKQVLFGAHTKTKSISTARVWFSHG